MHEADWMWAQDQFVAMTSHRDPTVRSVAATCLGHIARIHGRLDLAKVIPILEALMRDPSTTGCAETALDDIKTFVRS
jgi:vesicle coat complex subunit